MAFGPNPNPQYLVLAVIDQGGYGAQAAAPLVRNIFDYIAANPISAAGEDPDAGQPAQPDRADDQPAARARPTTTTTTTPKPGHAPATDRPRPPRRRAEG